MQTVRTFDHTHTDFFRSVRRRIERKIVHPVPGIVPDYVGVTDCKILLFPVEHKNTFFFCGREKARTSGRPQGIDQKIVPEYLTPFSNADNFHNPTSVW